MKKWDRTTLRQRLRDAADGYTGQVILATGPYMVLDLEEEEDEE